MSETNPPIVVNPSALPAVGGVIARYAAALLAGWLIRHGVIGDNDAALIEGLVLALLTAGYAIYRAYQNKATMVNVATDPRVPDAVMSLKETGK